MYSLAVVPCIALLIYIYAKDKKEKESKRLLIGCFVWGVIIIAPVLLIETILDEIFMSFLTVGSVSYAFAEGFIVAAFSEELFKYLALRGKTWKSKEFNCTFDGIVYAVFVSIGFATFENIMYVLDGGVSTALLRMFTAVPGHACDAVFMGYFYSKAKRAGLENNKKAEKKYKKYALLIPILLHGIYDWLISFDEEVVGEDINTIGFLIWIVFVIVLFIASFRTVNKASKNDSYFVECEIDE